MTKTIRERVFLGFTEDNEIVFSDIRYRDGRFSVTFDLSYPQSLDRDDQIEYYNEFDEETLFYVMKEHDLRPSEVADFLADHEDISDTFDTSLFPEVFEYEDQDIYFIAGSSGQVDTRNEMIFKVDEELYNYLIKLWDEYHLKDIETNKLNHLIELIARCKEGEDFNSHINRWLQLKGSEVILNLK